jgi:hypothetical protein
VYFDRYPDQQLMLGEVVSRPEPDCPAPIVQPASIAQRVSRLRPAPHADTALSESGRGRVRPAASVLTSGPAPLGAFCGAYYPGRFDGPALFTRQSALLNFDWSTDAPGGYWLDRPVDGFSARWSGQFMFPGSGSYVFAAMASGDVRVFVDGIDVLDRPQADREPSQVVVMRELVAGIHRVDVEQVSTDGRGMLNISWGRLLRVDGEWG